MYVYVSYFIVWASSIVERMWNVTLRVHIWKISKGQSFCCINTFKHSYMDGYVIYIGRNFTYTYIHMYVFCVQFIRCLCTNIRSNVKLQHKKIWICKITFSISYIYSKYFKVFLHSSLFACDRANPYNKRYINIRAKFADTIKAIY